MTKYVVKVGNGYLTKYGSITQNVCCAEKHKYEEDAESAGEASGKHFEVVTIG